MLFNDLKFIYFFIPVLIIFHSLNLTKKKWIKNIFLLAASYLFYGLFEPRFLLVLIYITIINYSTIHLLSNKKNNNIDYLYLLSDTGSKFFIVFVHNFRYCRKMQVHKLLQLQHFSKFGQPLPLSLQ